MPKRKVTARRRAGSPAGSSSTTRPCSCVSSRLRARKVSARTQVVCRRPREGAAPPSRRVLARRNAPWAGRARTAGQEQFESTARGASTLSARRRRLERRSEMKVDRGQTSGAVCRLFKARQRSGWPLQVFLADSSSAQLQGKRERRSRRSDRRRDFVAPGGERHRTMVDRKAKLHGTGAYTDQGQRTNYNTASREARRKTEGDSSSARKRRAQISGASELSSLTESSALFRRIEYSAV